MRPDDYRPEILVGPYYQWLYCVPYGPTQADRVLEYNYTPMLETADERRFVFAQLGRDIDGFEGKHTGHIQCALDILDTTYRQHGPTDQHTRRPRKHGDLADLTVSFEKCVYPITLSELAGSKTSPDRACELEQPSISCSPSGSTAAADSPCVFGETDIIPAADEDETCEDDVDQWAESVRTVLKKSRQRSTHHVRQFGTLRMRKAWTTKRMDDIGPKSATIDHG